MTSEVGDPKTAFVWVWLPGATEPVVAGRLDARGDEVDFTYGRSYLARPDAIALYEPELPLRPGTQPPPAGMRIAGCIDDGGPDAWGRRVVEHRRLRRGDDAAGDLGTIGLLLESASDRIGALDFQARADQYVARSGGGTLAEMVEAAERLERGEPLSPALTEALLHGTSVGGARPKVTLHDSDRELIAKLSSSRDSFPVVKAEGVASELARRVGLDAVSTEVNEAAGRDVLLVERFDRPGGGTRRMVVSALTMLGLDEMMGRYATYHELADLVRARFVEPAAALRELFSRITFNVCVSNTDDHARNHAAFWDGRTLELTPAFDLCPQVRTGGIAAQAMAFGRDGTRSSRLVDCIAHAEVFHLDRDEARAIVDRQLEVIHHQWEDAADAARLTEAERAQLWGRQILNPYALEDLP